jgi:hypothetical protein
MTLRTGTSKGGRVYRYYTCTTCVRKMPSRSSTPESVGV